MSCRLPPLAAWSLLALHGLAAACASSPPAPGATTLAPMERPIDFDAGPPRVATTTASSSASSSPPIAALASPRTPGEAGVLVGEAMASLQRGEKRAAVPRLQALLRSEFLSERGRANLYWLLADAADGVDDDARRDALGGYLVATSWLPDDADVRERRARARATLVAFDVVSASLGRTPEAPIDIGDAREAEVVAATLPCGRRGAGRYVAHASTSPRSADGLAMRRLLCTETGDELVLWFRLP
jgi:hypothetical protein